ncbi:hypothetical protein LTR36_007499 [Oleoguttula mirabilis]|uniref:RRM domain-containing protein n=1 Tax=Oleoguttula mirabilis TaxID=1507867 RepID=A0AAV9JTL0_9PEZI|nr:hypothetical protein LTR36_007499 [Oleoguttula mirabilis]
MNSETPSEPPEEPFQRSNPAVLSPASPKPIHFPTPTNIPVLRLQMDVDHNQIETHMADPAMHNTAVRPDFWRDPSEQEGDHASPYSTGGDAAETAKEETSAASVTAQDSADSKATTASESADPEPVQLSNDASHQANALLEVQAEPEAATNGESQALADPSVPAAAAEGPTLPDALHTYPDEVKLDSAPFAPAFNGNVDVQALLDTLQVPPAASTVNGAPFATPMNPLSPASSAQPAPPGAEVSASVLSAPPPGALPARPPPQEQPLIHPNYVHSQHIRDYHPHAAHSAFQPHQGLTGAPGTVADPSSRNHVPPVYSPSSASAAAAQTPQQQQFYPLQASPTSATPTTANNFHSALQTPISVQQGYPTMTNTPIESRRESALAAGQPLSADDRPWDASIQAKYDHFIESERAYVSEGRWEQFPPGSRLFVGNLSSEKVTKRDIFHVFHSYGDLAQVSIKQAYGFVQFLRQEDCARALDAEQGTWIRDKRIHLEVSKPQKNRSQAQGRDQGQQQGRRSRSPAQYGRGKSGAGVDRYVSGRNSDVGSGGRGGGQQSGYRSTASGSFRSPSPPSRSSGGGGGGGYRDRYDDRGTRARSPDYTRGGGAGVRFRSPSPQRRSEDDDLPLPRRAARDVPDVQILVLEQLDREFISWIEKAFSARSVRVDVLLLSPRLSEAAVVRRQIVEGVAAVVKLTKANMGTGRIGLQIFDRRGGAGSVQFEEYDNLDPGICAELVIRAKGTHAAPAPAPPPPQQTGYGGYGAQTGYAAPASQPPPQQQGYGGGYGAPPPPTPYGLQQQTPQQAPYAPPPSYAQAPPQMQPPPPQNLQNLITSLDPSGLQNLLAAMGQQGGQQPQQAPSAPQYGQDYGRQQQAAMVALQRDPGMVAGVLQQQQQHQHQQQQHQQQQQMYGGMPGGGMGGQQPPPPQQQQQGGAGGSGQQQQQPVNMQEILARLGTYKQ